MEEVVKIAKGLRKVFENYLAVIQLPFFDSYPNNSCEGASCLLAYHVKLYFPEKEVFVIHGRSFDDYENHYWVEIDGYLFDLTVDQFEEVDSPVYKENSHPMSDFFCNQEKHNPVTFFGDYAEKYVAIKDLIKIYAQIVQQLNLQTE